MIICASGGVRSPGPVVVGCPSRILAALGGPTGADHARVANRSCRFHHGVLVGLSDTLDAGTRPGERKARLLLQVLRDRQALTCVTTM